MIEMIEITSPVRLEAHTTFEHEGKIFKITKCIVDSLKEGYVYLAKLVEKSLPRKENQMTTLLENEKNLDVLNEVSTKLDAINCKLVDIILNQFDEIKSDFFASIVGLDPKILALAEKFLFKNTLNEIKKLKEVFEWQENSNSFLSNVPEFRKQIDEASNIEIGRLTSLIKNILNEEIKDNPCELWFAIADHSEKFKQFLPTNFIENVIVWKKINDLFCEVDSLYQKRKKEQE